MVAVWVVMSDLSFYTSKAELKGIVHNLAMVYERKEVSEIISQFGGRC
jgi:hypothetical protein